MMKCGMGIGKQGSASLTSIRQVQTRKIEAEALAVGWRSTGAHVGGQPLRDAFRSADWNTVAIAEHP